MAIAEVASRRAIYVSGSQANLAGAFPGAVTAGNLLVVAGTVYQSPQPTSVAVTHSVGTALSYTVKFYQSPGSGGRCMFIAYGIAPASETPTVLVDPNGSAYITFAVDEFSFGAVPLLDVDASYLDGSGTAPSMNILTVAAATLIIGVMGNDNLRTFTKGASYTLIGEDHSNEAALVQFKIVASATTYAVDGTLTGGGGWTVQAASFKATPAAGFLNKPTIRQQALTRAASY